MIHGPSILRLFCFNGFLNLSLSTYLVYYSEVKHGSALIGPFHISTEDFTLKSVFYLCLESVFVLREEVETS